MSHEHSRALKRIVTVCEASREMTHRTLRVLDIALEGLGLTANQRDFQIEQLRIATIQRSRAQTLAKITRCVR